MPASLATAYVQVVPSTDGLSKGIASALNDGSAAKAGESVGKSFVGSLKGIITTAAIGKAVKTALEEGAALQQSRGGVETLFKDQADNLKALADEAYRTVGLSANDYMETVTSFSAPLLQSLEGDTAKAVEVADMALVDMADNANKFSTDMQSVQNAYQSFARGVYTTLDNLKLGYGGTRAEMQRLLEDASKLSGIDYDISSLADVYEAIHVIQQELGVTGTTAQEASETFSGSLASMRAAAKNLIGKMSLGEDFSAELNSLADVAGTFFKDNLGPMLYNLGLSVADAAPGIVFGLVEALIENAPAIADAGVEIAKTLIQAIWRELKAFFKGLSMSRLDDLDNYDVYTGQYMGAGYNSSSSVTNYNGSISNTFNVSGLAEAQSLISASQSAERLARMGMTEYDLMY